MLIELPDELALHVASFLNERDILALQLSCTHFRRLLDDAAVWSAIAYKRWPYEARYAKITSQHDSFSWKAFVKSCKQYYGWKQKNLEPRYIHTFPEDVWSLCPVGRNATGIHANVAAVSLVACDTGCVGLVFSRPEEENEKTRSQVLILDTASGRNSFGIHTPEDGNCPIIAASILSKIGVWNFKAIMESADNLHNVSHEFLKPATIVELDRDHDLRGVHVISAGGQIEVLGCSRRIVGIFDVDHQHLITKIEVHTIDWDGPMISAFAMAASQDPNIFITVAALAAGGNHKPTSTGSEILLWDKREPTKPVLSIFDMHQDEVWDASIDPTGRMITTASYDGTVKTHSFDMAAREYVAAFAVRHPVRNVGFRSAAFDAALGRLVTGDKRGTIHVWQYDPTGREEGKPLSTLATTDGFVRTLRFDGLDGLFVGVKRELRYYYAVPHS